MKKQSKYQRAESESFLQRLMDGMALNRSEAKIKDGLVDVKIRYERNGRDEYRIFNLLTRSNGRVERKAHCDESVLSAKASRRKKPPQLAATLLVLLYAGDHLAEYLALVAEEFRKVAAMNGLWPAYACYWKHVIILVLPIVQRLFKWVLGMAFIQKLLT
ncbi:MAG TPA: hypothetical protein VEF04_05470 [Blastocatellia bacterium]|nr:hypothetical protein [Blastocatellia bacterium]